MEVLAPIIVMVMICLISPLTDIGTALAARIRGRQRDDE
jgi:hypothetical protein